MPSKYLVQWMDRAGELHEFETPSLKLALDKYWDARRRHDTVEALVLSSRTGYIARIVHWHGLN